MGGSSSNVISVFVTDLANLPSPSPTGARRTPGRGPGHLPSQTGTAEWIDWAVDPVEPHVEWVCLRADTHYALASTVRMVEREGGSHLRHLAPNSHPFTQPGQAQSSPDRCGACHVAVAATGSDSRHDHPQTIRIVGRVNGSSTRASPDYGPRRPPRQVVRPRARRQSYTPTRMGLRLETTAFPGLGCVISVRSGRLRPVSGPRSTGSAELERFGANDSRCRKEAAL